MKSTTDHRYTESYEMGSNTATVDDEAAIEAKAGHGSDTDQNRLKSSPSGPGEISLVSDEQLHRGLKSRHIQFLALGGAIGTGLFVGSGQILAIAGPAPLFMGYMSMLFIVWNIMNDLAEMVTLLPMRGVSIPYLVGRYVEPSLAFADGWNYWYAYAILVATEGTAGAIIMNYWVSEATVNPGVWIAIILVVILLLNIITVEYFGEAEFWFASIKLITIIGLIILGIVLFFGGGPDQGRLGFRYWEPLTATNGDWGAFKTYMAPGATGRFLAYWTATIRAGFAYITSPELIALAAGETVAPRRNVPKAARRFVWRLAIFYGMSSLVIGVIVPCTSERLLSGASNASASPFVIGIQLAGISGLNHVINAAVLTSAWSAGNAFLYSGSRVLYSMALNNQAPRIFTKTSKKGVPYYAVLLTWAIGLLGFLNVSNSGAQVFTWFTNISTISGFIAWIVVCITYLRFRKAMIYNNLMHTLPYRTPGQPYATWVIMTALILLTLTNGFQVFFPSEWNPSDFVAAYITLPIFLVLYLGHKAFSLKQKGPLFARRVEDIDVTTGIKEMDELAARDVERVPKNWLEKAWFWLA